MNKIRKAIVPIVGSGTLSWSGEVSVPRSMFPIMNKPAIEFIVEEAIRSGIEEIFIIGGNEVRLIEDHLGQFKGKALSDHGKDMVINNKASSYRLHYVRQSSIRTMGEAILAASSLIGDEAFAVLSADVIFPADSSGLSQLLQQFDVTSSTVIGVQQNADTRRLCFGAVNTAKSTKRLAQVTHFEESATYDSAFSVIGRYVLTPEVIRILSNMAPDQDGRIKLSVAMKELNKHRYIYAYELYEQAYPINNHFECLKTSLELAVQDEHFHEDIVRLLHDVQDEAKKKRQVSQMTV